jgi:hypothetical protein
MDPSWNTDTGVSALSNEIFQPIGQHQKSAQGAGELEDTAPTYEKPMQTIKAVPSISQRIRFNLIRHRGTQSFIPSGKLFKSFFKTLQNVDPTLVFLPYHTAHYSSLLNIKQIQEINDAKLLQFFKPYYQKQRYSISGYVHISSTLTFQKFSKFLW